MRRFIRHGFVGLAICLSAPASAANWIYATTTVDDADWYIDSETIEDRSGFRYFWIKIDASKDTTVEYYEDKRRYKAKCSSRKLGLISWAEYDREGRVVDSRNFPDYTYVDSNMKDVPPDTVGDTVLTLVCG